MSVRVSREYLEDSRGAVTVRDNESGALFFLELGRGAHVQPYGEATRYTMQRADSGLYKLILGRTEYIVRDGFDAVICEVKIAPSLCGNYIPTTSQPPRSRVLLLT